MTDTPDPLSERPLVTFALFAYNQEKYIREAVEGAFSQTYEPLEIILSDDCSSDRTFEIMQEMAAAYEGPHKVILNRNMSNLGLVNHVNFLSRISKGEYIVAAAGDDISISARTETVIDKVLESQPCLVHSNVQQIDCHGKPISKFNYDPTFWSDTNPNAAAESVSLYIGATGVWSKYLFLKYGDITLLNSYEDLVLGYRAALEEKVEFVNKPLVLYRVGVGISHSGNIGDSSKKKKEFELRTIKSQIDSLEQRLLDTDISNRHDKQILKLKIKKKITLCRAKQRFYVSVFQFVILDSWRPLVFREVLAVIMKNMIIKRR